jgi:hypothetical protein
LAKLKGKRRGDGIFGANVASLVVQARHLPFVLEKMTGQYLHIFLSFQKGNENEKKKKIEKQCNYEPAQPVYCSYSQTCLRAYILVEGFYDAFTQLEGVSLQ